MRGRSRGDGAKIKSGWKRLVSLLEQMYGDRAIYSFKGDGNILNLELCWIRSQ